MAGEGRAAAALDDTILTIDKIVGECIILLL